VFVQVLLSDGNNTARQTALGECEALDPDTSHLDLSLPNPGPAPAPCAPGVNPSGLPDPDPAPCESAWTSTWYNGMIDLLDCVACPALPPHLTNPGGGGGGGGGATDGCSRNGWTLAMRFASTGSTFEYASPYWTNGETLNAVSADTTCDPAKDEDAKFDVFNTVSATQIRGCLGAFNSSTITNQCFTYNLSAPTTLKALFSDTPDGYAEAQTLGDQSEALRWVAATGKSACTSGWGGVGFNYVDTVSSYVAKVRFGAMTNNEASINTANDAIGFGIVEASGCQEGAGMACYSCSRYPQAGTIWVKA